MGQFPPIGPEEFKTHMTPLGPFLPGDTLAVAVSGGGDSMALTLLLNDWAKTHGFLLVAVTIDHGLRPESGKEAITVGRWLSQYGIPHHIVTWRGDKETGRRQEKARFARHRLLYDFCWERGIQNLFMAHHHQDQQETIRMRQEKGSTFMGLGGMESVRPFLFGRIVRPLLTVPKERLQATLRAAKQHWIEDPSNLNPVFWRGAYRRNEGSHPPPLSWEDAQKWADLREQNRAQLKSLMARVHHHPCGWGSMAWDDFKTMNPSDQSLLIAHLIRIYGRGDYPPSRTGLSNLMIRLSTQNRGTLGHCFMFKRGAHLIAVREVQNLPAPLLLTTLLENSRFIWFDNRFWLEWPQGLSKGAGGGLTIRPLLARDWPDFRAKNVGVTRDMPYLAALTLPALYRGDTFIQVLMPKIADGDTQTLFSRCLFSGNNGYALTAI